MMKKEYLSKILICGLLSLFGVWCIVKIIASPNFGDFFVLILTLYCMNLYLKLDVRNYSLVQNCISHDCFGLCIKDKLIETHTFENKLLYDILELDDIEKFADNIKCIKGNQFDIEIPLPVYLTDNCGRYIWGNKKFNNLIGIKSEDLFGRNLSEIFDGSDSQKLKEENKRVILERRTIINEHLYNMPNNPLKWFRVYKTPIFDEYGSVSKIVAFLEDISAEKELNIQKKRFMATLNHDLKTPVIAQMRSIEMLLNGTFGEINEKQREILELTVNSCDNIYKMVSAIISSYKLENNEIKLNYSKIDFNELVIECCGLMKESASEKNIKIKIKPKNHDNIINADVNYLKPAVIFLIENSISYSYNNSDIEIIIDNDGKNLKFEINTKSPYIPQETLQKMLHKYLGQISNYNKIGFCMKLNYCNQVIKAHNGILIAESKPSEKNKLGFSLPVLLVSATNV